MPNRLMETMEKPFVFFRLLHAYLWYFPRNWLYSICIILLFVVVISNFKISLIRDDLNYHWIFSCPFIGKLPPKKLSSGVFSNQKMEKKNTLFVFRIICTETINYTYSTFISFKNEANFGQFLVNFGQFWSIFGQFLVCFLHKPWIKKSIFQLISFFVRLQIAHLL